MAVVGGFYIDMPWYDLARSGYAPELSSNLDEMTFDPVELPVENVLVMNYYGALVSHLPVEVHHFAVPGRHFPSFFDDYYNRIHVRPDSLDLGSVVSTQTTPTLVWNAYLQSLTLEEITGLDEGIELTGQPEPPLLFLPLEENLYNLSITPDGPAIIDNNIVWHFSNDAIGTVSVTGVRIVAWWLRPDWSDGILERLEWYTTIATSPLGVEQRRSMRLSPRRFIKMKSIANATDRRFVELSIGDAGGRNWALPFWPHNQFTDYQIPAGAFELLINPTHFDYEDGGMVMVGSDNSWDSEVLEIDTVEADRLILRRPTTRSWPPGTRVVPGKVARFKDQPVMHRLTDEAVSIDLHFEQTRIASYPAALPTPMYRAKPIYRDRPEESEDLTTTAVRLMKMIENNTSLPLYFDTAKHSFRAQGHKWQLYGRAAQDTFRRFVYAMGGRWKSVWVPTHYADLTMVEPMEATSALMIVNWTGYTKMAAFTKPGFRDIQIMLRNGTYKYMRVTNAEEWGPGRERLVLDTQPGVPIQPEDVLRISFMSIMRLDQDFIEINHVTDSDGLAESKAVFYSVRDDV